MATFSRVANRTAPQADRAPDRTNWRDNVEHWVKGNEYDKQVRENDEHPAHARSQSDIESYKRAAKSLFKDRG